jgi:phosphatidylglycerophosphate synthase
VTTPQPQGSRRLRFIPGAISSSRLLAGPIIAVAAWWGSSPGLIFWIVLAAACSDYLDGWLARRLRASSYEGKIIDFLADKVFLIVVLLVLARSGVLSPVVAGVLAGYHLVVLLATTVISWGMGRPLIAVPTSERLVLIFNYVLVTAGAGRMAFQGKAVYSTLLWMGGILSLASVGFGAIGYLRLTRRLLSGFPR